MQIDGCGAGSRRQPFLHASTLGTPPAHDPRELPSFEHVGVVSPANSPQLPASAPAASAPPASLPPASAPPELPPLPELLPLPLPELPPELPLLLDVLPPLLPA
jgi:hypothetical protein